MCLELAGEVLAASDRALRVLETSHPPTIYLPPDDVRFDLLAESRHGGPGASSRARRATSTRWSAGVAWWRWAGPTRRRPRGYEALRDHVAFYPGRVDAAWLGDERVQAQESGFYGGWITRDLVGPFKGPPGTRGW